jgi:hypothetical protein
MHARSAAHGSLFFWPYRSPTNSWNLQVVKKTITIKNLVKSVLGFSMILSACAAIFVGVGGGYRSPLASSPDDSSMTDGRMAASPPHSTALSATRVRAAE